MKTAKFIKDRYNNIIYFVNSLKTLHSKLKHEDINKLANNNVKQTPYRLFLSWFLEILQYGTILIAIYYWFPSSVWYVKGIGFGLTYWMIKTAIKEIKGL